MDIIFPQCTNWNRIRNLHFSKILFLFLVSFTLNTKLALPNFICIWNLVLICWKTWSPEPEKCRNRNPHIFKIGKLLLVCLTNNSRRSDHIFEPHEKFGENWGVYIPIFGKISVKISVTGVLYLIIAPMGVKFGMDSYHAKFHPHRCNMSPRSGEKKTQNLHLSNLYTSTLHCRQCCQ